MVHIKKKILKKKRGIGGIDILNLKYPKQYPHSPKCSHPPIFHFSKGLYHSLLKINNQTTLGVILASFLFFTFHIQCWHYLQIDLYIHFNPYQTPSRHFFCRNWQAGPDPASKADPKIWKCIGHKISKTILKKKNKVEDLYFIISKYTIKPLNQNTVVLA